LGAAALGSTDLRLPGFGATDLRLAVLRATDLRLAVLRVADLRLASWRVTGLWCCWSALRVTGLERPILRSGGLRCALPDAALGAAGVRDGSLRSRVVRVALAQRRLRTREGLLRLPGSRLVPASTRQRYGGPFRRRTCWCWCTAW
jgi:hypothetical protein